MTKKQFLQMLLFLTTTGLMVFSLFYFFQSDENTNNTRRWNGFYAEDENTLDGVFIGASMVDRAWIPPLSWNESGIAVYTLSTSRFPIVATTAVLDEVLKTQDPELIIIDVHSVRSKLHYATQGDLRFLVDSMHYTSKNRLKVIEKVTANNDAYEKEFGEVTVKNNSPNTKKIDLSDLSYFIPFINYHSRWETGLTKADYLKTPNKFKGAVDMYKWRTATEVLERPVLTSESELSPFFQNVLTEIMDYGKEKNLDILFVALPTIVPESQTIEVNGALEFAKNAGYNTINMNTDECYDDMNLNFAEDFRDKVHLNSNGAVKATLYITNYLKENYTIKDKRNDPQYESWDRSWEDYCSFFNEDRDITLENYLVQLNNSAAE